MKSINPSASSLYLSLARPVFLWLAIVAATGTACAQSNYATPYAFGTLAGAFSSGSANGPGRAARFHEPSDVAVDSSGNVYVADTLNEVIRKIDPAGNVSTLAGTPGIAGTNDGTGAAARFHWPFGVAVDTAGNIYVTDNGSNTIRKVTPAGVVTTLAGSADTQGSADGTGSAAQFHNPTYLAVDSAGAIYVVDNGTTVRKVSPSGTVTTLAGTSGVKGSVDGAGPAASFTSLQGIAVDAAGNAFVGDSTSSFAATGSDLIRKVTPGGQVTTLTLTGANSPSETPLGFWVGGLTLAPSGGLYVSSIKQDLIFAVTPDGVVSQLAGKFVNGFEGTLVDGAGSSARFDQPGGITTDHAGNVFVADTGNNAIRKIDPSANVSTVAGLGWNEQIGSADGTGSTARFGGQPLAVAVAASGDVFIADFGNYTIRKVTPAGVVTTLAGLAGASGHVDGQGTAARFDAMFGLTIDKVGNLYVPELTADSHQNYSFYNIRKITSDGTVTTLTPAPPVTVHWSPFWGRTNLVVDDSASFYIPFGSTIVKLAPDGTTATLAGSDTFAEGAADGTGSAATFSSALSLAIDRSGTIYVADIGNETIRKVTPAGVVTTLAGLAGIAGHDDGTGSSAQFYSPRGLAVDASGNVYVADTGNQLIRKVTPAGVVTTLGGLVGDQVTADGVGIGARFFDPESIAVDANGSVFVAGYNGVRRGQPAGAPAIMTQPQGQTVAAGMTVKFSVVVSGAPDPTYQWQFNGSPISGATSDTLNLPNVRDSDAGDYSVVATNSLGTVTSSKATLAITASASGTTSSAPASGGGGSIGGWLVLALALLSAVRGMANWSRVRLPSVEKPSRVADFAGPTPNKGSEDYPPGSSPAPMKHPPLFARKWFVVAGALLLFVGPLARGSTYTSPYDFTTVAGAASIGSSDGLAKDARFYSPRALAVDTHGNLYVADSMNDTIRKISADGIVSTLAGVPGYIALMARVAPDYTTIDGTGSGAVFFNPEGISVDGNGTVYVSDKLDFTIRKITPEGVVTTFAGTTGVTGSADGTGKDAQFFAIAGTALDGAGNLYVAEWINHTIRKITPGGVVTTFAGTAEEAGSADGTGSEAKFFQPVYIAADPAGNLYVSDAVNQNIRKISPLGVVTTLAGTAMQRGSADGQGAAAQFDGPQGIALDPAGNLYVADSVNSTIRKITPDGLVTTFAGMPGVPGSADGTGAGARFRNPQGVAADSAGVVYVCDSTDNTIRKITPDGVVTTIAGLGLDQATGNADGLGRSARFQTAIQIAAGTSGDAVLADTFNHTIRRISAAGVVTTIAGNSADSSGGITDGTGPSARFAAPGPIAVGASGTIFVGELGNGTIRKITSDQVVTTLNATSPFDRIGGVAADALGNVYVSDSGRNTIQQLSATGVVTTLAGTAGVTGSSNGPAGSAGFAGPGGLAVDGAGNLFVADTGNHTIRRISASGLVTTLAGVAGVQGDADGPSGSARFSYPNAIALDESGDLFVADGSNSTIRKISPDGIVSTLAGKSGLVGNAEGMGSQARFDTAISLAADARGNLLVANGSTILKGQLAGPPVINTQPASLTAMAGGDARFSVNAGGAPAPTYQWFFNGSAISGANASALSLSNLRDSDAGSYKVVVTNTLGTATSSVATLNVNAAPTPPTSTTPAAATGGGGGAMGGGFALALGLLAATRARRPGQAVKE